MRFPEASAVRKATKGDVDTILDCLADEFQEDPVMRRSRPNRRIHAMHSSSRFVFVSDMVTYIAADGAGAAAWLPPAISLAYPVTPGVIWKGLTHYGRGSLLRGLATLIPKLWLMWRPAC